MIVDGLGTRHNFPDYIARRPAMALMACAELYAMIKAYHEEGRELPCEIPPAIVLMTVEMACIVEELRAPGLVIALELPPGLGALIRRYTQ